MIILQPTCDTHTQAAAWSQAMLTKHWPDHPPLKLTHSSNANGPTPWLPPIVDALQQMPATVILLLLDDYAICRKPDRRFIAHVAELVSHRLADACALTWYPGQRRPFHADPSIDELITRPLLLQAMVWDSAAFLRIAAAVSADCSASGFEAAATQALKKLGLTILAPRLPQPCQIGPHLIDGQDKRHWPLPYHNLMHRGAIEPHHVPWLIRQGLLPPRGLGDSIAKMTTRIGIEPCDACHGRRDALNALVPYRRAGS